MSTELQDTLQDFTHTADPAAYATIEQALLEHLQLPHRHIPDAETQAHDAILTHSIQPGEYDIPGTQIVFPADTPLEIKTCQEWIVDTNSRNNRRRGRFHIRPSTHDAFEGAYILAVINQDKSGLRAVAMLDHEALDTVVHDTATNQGTGRGQISAIPWTRVLDTRGYQA